jgi:mannitol 2-dehydrogenase
VIQFFPEEELDMSDLFWFTDAQWSRIAPLLPRNTRGMKRVDDRRVISGIVHVLKSGGRWSDAPADYGPKKTLYNRFVRWSARGIWQDIFADLSGVEGIPDRLMIDSSSIKVHRCARGAKGGPWPMLLVAARVDRTPKSMP